MLNIDKLRSQMLKVSENNEDGEIWFRTGFNYEESNDTVCVVCNKNSGVVTDNGGLMDVLLDYASADDFRDNLIKMAPEFGVRYEDGYLIAEGKDFVESFNAIVQASIILSARLIEQIRVQRENEPECFVGEEDL